jgi:hypothetical protein
MLGFVLETFNMTVLPSESKKNASFILFFYYLFYFGLSFKVNLPADSTWSGLLS